MAIIYHGTSEESYKSILENGFNPIDADVLTWNCSDSDYVYFYNPLDLLEHGETDEEENAEQMAIERAFENAKISAAVQKSRGDSVYVLAVEIDQELIEEDDSCQNMELACKVHVSYLSTDAIIKKFRADYLPSISLAYIAGLNDSDFINLENFSRVEVEMMKVLAKSDLMSMDELLYNEWEEEY